MRIRCDSKKSPFFGDLPVCTQLVQQQRVQ
jgi:hypothetical protein